MRNNFTIFGFSFFFCIGLISSCAKESIISFSETTLGKNTLAFTIEGIKIYQETCYHYHERYARYYEDSDSGIIRIHADLTSNHFPEIDLSFPAYQVSAITSFAPKVEMTYEFLPPIYEPHEHGGGHLTRSPEYRSISITESNIEIRYFDNNILAGRFSLKGEYADSLGNIHPVVIDDGIFDVTNSYTPKHWN